MSRLRTHGRTNMWKYSAWAESAIFNIGVDFHWCVENNNDALRMARLLCEAISNALWSQYQRLSEQTISMLCPRLSSASSPWLASPHCNTTHTDVQLWSKCSSRIYVFSAISHWFYFLNCGFCLSRILLYLPSGVCRRVSMCHRRDISDFLHCVLDRTNQIFSESTWYHYPLTNLPLTHHPPWPTRPKKNTNLDFSPLYDILHQTNHKFSESMWHLLSTVALMAQVALNRHIHIVLL